MTEMTNDKKMPQETDRDWVVAQYWKGMDGAIAWHLIERHAEGWAEVGAMMEAWRLANLAALPEE